MKRLSFFVPILLCCLLLSCTEDQAAVPGMDSLEPDESPDEVVSGPKVIAHRGFHPDGVQENSIESLAGAQEMNVHASEVDVRLTEDDEIVCSHGRIDSDMQDLPTLDAMLDQLAKTDDTRLVIDLKGNEDYYDRYKLAYASFSLVRRKNLLHRIDFISNDIRICNMLSSMVRGGFVGYMQGDLTPSELHSKGVNCLCYKMAHLNEHPEWIDEARSLGMKINVWTVNSEDDMVAWVDADVDYITTDYPDLLLELIR